MDDLDAATDATGASRSRGRPRRPTAQKSVHQLVLNLTQTSEKKSQKDSNKRQKTIDSSSSGPATPVTTAPTAATTTPSTTPTVTPTTTVSEAPLRWKVGQKVEARDVLGDWYSAKIVSFSDDKARVLVHFERWSSRYDQWFARDSDLIREKSACEEARDSGGQRTFGLHEEVLARWTDNRSYPATVVELLDGAVHVLFHDGYRKKVKLAQIEKMPPNYGGERAPGRPAPTLPELQCTRPDCAKTFRKQSLLAQHIKHYHKNEQKQEEPAPPAPPTPAPPPPPEPAEATPTEKAPPVARVKRKYVRKPCASSATRKSHRQSSPMTSLAPPPVVPDTPLTTPTAAVSAARDKETKEVANTTLPFWDARTVAEIHEADPEELVNCVCDAREESGLMVQCECCLCWQHAHCMNFDGEHDVPEDGYFCLACRFPKHARHSRRNAFLVNHALKSGKRPEFPFGQKSVDEREAAKETAAVLAQALEVRHVLGSTWSATDEDARERLESAAARLAVLERRVQEMEAENERQWTDAEVKREMALMAADLSRVRRLS